jgi:cyanophycinase-like exopeptidase
MTLRRAFLFVLLLPPFLGAVPKSYAQDEVLYMTGGGYRSKDAIHEIVQNAPHTPNEPLKVVYLGYASKQPEVALKSYADQLFKEGILPCQIIPLMKPPEGAAEELEHANLIRQGGAIVMAGGDQSRLVPALQKPAVFAAMKERSKAKVPIMVTSASSAQMGPIMFTGNWKVTPQGIEFETIPGLNWLPDVIVDTHFLTYHLLGEDATTGVIGREGRVVYVLTHSDIVYAIALDEDATVKIVNKEHLTVIGPQQVILYRRVGDKVERISLWHGDQVNLKNWKITFADPSTPCNWMFSGPPALKRAPIDYPLRGTVEIR